MITETKLTEEHLDALRCFRRYEGRFWKSKLRQCWINASCPGYAEETACLLQQFRNRWPHLLDKIKL